jgi:hypothetical protein
MHNSARFPRWLLGGIGAWLAWSFCLSALHLQLLSQWGVPYSIHLYAPDPSTPLSLGHALLIGMISPAFFCLQAFSALNLHLPWLDAIIYNWRAMVFLSSGPAFLIGALSAAWEKRSCLAAAIISLLLLIGGVLFILNTVHAG